MKQKLWTNKKQFGKKQFFSHYYKDTVGERVFILIEVVKQGKIPREITFESWQMAKKLGWVKLSILALALIATSCSSTVYVKKCEHLQNEIYKCEEI